MPTLPVAVISDIVCPWCFLGKRHLEAAAALRPEVDLRVEWRPFLLDPNIPPGGVDRERYLVAKFGDVAALDAVQDRLSEMGAEAGIHFAWDRMRRIPNTLTAHRLLTWVRTHRPQLQSAVQEGLFRANFEEGLDVSAPDVLVAIAVTAGLDGDEIRAWLATDEDRDLVLREASSYPRAGISGVPFFVFGDPAAGDLVACSGAQPPAVLAEAIDAALSRCSRDTQVQATAAGVCGEEGCRPPASSREA